MAVECGGVLSHLIAQPVGVGDTEAGELGGDKFNRSLHLSR